jgi:arylsulfatase
MGGITEIATSDPGYNSIRPDNAALLAETMKLTSRSSCTSRRARHTHRIT